MRARATRVYNIKKGRAMRVYGIMRGRDMRAYRHTDVEGHESVWHYEGECN